jgi:SAM-dependent methyltransferase
MAREMKTYYTGGHARRYNQAWRHYSEKTLAATRSAIDLARLQDAASNLDRPLRVLDAGCGTGLLIAQLVPLIPHAEWYGVDESQEMLSQAALILQGHPHMHLVQASLRGGVTAGLPYQPASFALITCTNTFHYLEDPGAVLLGLKQLLAPLGQLVIEDYARREFPFPWKVFEWFIKRDDPGHIRAYTLTEAQALCRQAGLQVALAKTFPIDVLWKGWVVRTEI